MLHSDFVEIEQRAGELRTEEIQHINGFMFKRMRVSGQLMSSMLLTILEFISELLRPLFSWNPQTPASRRHAAQP